MLQQRHRARVRFVAGIRSVVGIGFCRKLRGKHLAPSRSRLQPTESLENGDESVCLRQGRRGNRTSVEHDQISCDIES